MSARKLTQSQRHALERLAEPTAYLSGLWVCMPIANMPRRAWGSPIHWATREWLRRNELLGKPVQREPGCSWVRKINRRGRAVLRAGVS